MSDELRLDHNLGEIDDLFRGLSLSMGDNKPDIKPVAKDYNPLGEIFRCSKRNERDADESETFECSGNRHKTNELRELSDALESVSLSNTSPVASPRSTTTDETLKSPQLSSPKSNTLRNVDALHSTPNGDLAASHPARKTSDATTSSYESARSTATDDVTSTDSDDDCFEDCFDSPGGVATDKRLHPEKIFIFG